MSEEIIVIAGVEERVKALEDEATSRLRLRRATAILTLLEWLKDIVVDVMAAPP